MDYCCCRRRINNLFQWRRLLLIFVLFLKTQMGFSALILSLRNHHNKHHNSRPMVQAANQSSCALFVGTWVPDRSYPLYLSSNCPLVDPQFNCQSYGRPDSNYLRYRWKPLNCELPRFNGVDFLERMRGKTLMFVGDSLGRNQWESLLCMILASAPPSTSTQMSRGMPLSIFKFLDYGVVIQYYKAPFLVDIDLVQGKRILKLEDISGNGNAFQNADVLVFNTGHWWSHQNAQQGWDYMESGGTYYQDMDRLVAMAKALRTWAKWVDYHIDPSTTRVFFQSISPTHYDPNEWGGAPTTSLTTATTKNCYGETAPTTTTGTTTTMPQGEDVDQMRVIEEVLTDMHYPAYLLDITMLSQQRKDCHPSIYSGDLNPQQRVNPNRYADCSHWCLPGLPDTWNELFYTALFF